MTILCTGASGLVGWNFVKAAAEAGHKIVALRTRNSLPALAGVKELEVDLTDFNAVQRAVLDAFPEAIVNCAAVSSPADVDSNPELAEKLNAALPEKLAVYADHVGARFIHISSDMVFDGSAAPYKNTDVPCPLNLYGQTKLLAEKKVLKVSAPTTVVLRTSHVSGNSLTRKRSFHEKLLRIWASGEKAKRRTDDIKRATSVRLLASTMVELCERKNVSGIYHYAGLESLSRYEMAVRIARKFGLDPNEYVEPVEGDRYVDLSLDMSCLAARIKTRTCMFNEILDEMEVPPDLEEWLKKASGSLPVKRYKL